MNTHTKRATTMKLKENDYAKVAERIRLFREDCPQGSIKTTPHMQSDGRVIFEAHILKDKSDPNSADANAHSIGEVGKKDKDFEKLETIAIGRALANMGYLASGDVASDEEMVEFTEYKENKMNERREAVITLLEAAENLDALKDIFLSSGFAGDASVVEAKDKAKQKLMARVTE